jgi:hypothetical protein
MLDLLLFAVTSITRQQRTFDYFGVSVCALDDLDGDDVQDIAVGSPPEEIWILSGASGSPVLRIRIEGQHLWHAVASAGDVDADGWNDLLAQRADRHVLVLDGKSGEILHEIDASDRSRKRSYFPRLGLGGVGDLDEDGHADFLAGRAVYSGATGEVLIRYGRSTALTSDEEDAGLHRLDDVDGDGHFDLYEQVGELGRVFSGATGRILWRLGGLRQESVSEYTTSARVVGDLDADRVPDVAICHPAVCSGCRGFVNVHCGRTGRVLVATDRGDPWVTLDGAQVVGLGDVDGDGIPDFAVSMEGSIWDEVRICSGKDGSAIHIVPQRIVSGCRFSLAAIEDVDRDGVTDLVVGETMVPGSAFTTGSVRVVSGESGRVVHVTSRESAVAGLR